MSKLIRFSTANKREIEIVREDVSSEKMKQILLPSNHIELAIAEQGLPFIPGLTPEEELIALLKMAAEIEHGLMIQYLYAAYSCTDGGLSRTIATIGIEEMGHLLTVQNVLLAMGEKPYLGRYGSASPSQFDPFPFALEPLNKKVVAKYALCERPDENEIDVEDKETYQQILAELGQTIDSNQIKRVGLLYAKIYWLLRENDIPLTDPSDEPWDNYPVEFVARMMQEEGWPNFHVSVIPVSTSILQATHLDWGNNISNVKIEQVEILQGQGRVSALKAIAVISAQGEGFAGETDGHFDRFVKAYRNMATDFNMVKPFVSNPWYAGGIATGPPESQITNPRAVSLSQLGDIIYALLLNYIALAIHPDFEGNSEKRAEIADYTIKGIMMGIYKPLVNSIDKIPLRMDGTSDKLSLCFSMPQSPNDVKDIKANITQKLKEGIDLSDKLRAEADMPFLLKTALNNISRTLGNAPGNASQLFI